MTRSRTNGPMRLDRNESGVTVIELAVSMIIFTVVLTVFYSVLFNVQQSVVTSTDRSISNDQARLALQQIDREVRSGNVFYDPASLDGLGLRVYTQANAPTRQKHRCIEWRVADEELQSRSWATTWQADNDVAEWRTIATGIKNTDANPAFSRPSASLLVVTLMVNEDEGSGRNVEVTSSITGRNTQYGYPVTPCNDIPPA